MNKSKDKYDKLVVKTNNENSFDTRWSELKIDGKNIPSRSNHVAIFSKNMLYIHGGYDAEKGTLSDMYCLNIATDVQFFEWKVLNSQINSVPLKLKNHSAVNYKDKIVIFGGEAHSNESTNKVYCYDIETDMWSEVKTKSKFQIPKIDSHATLLIGNKMYVYGGYKSEVAEYNGSIYCLDLDSLEWEMVYEWKEGQQPRGRSNLGFVCDDNCLWVFGGIYENHTLNDFWKFDLKVKKWSKVESTNTPEPRRGHSMVEFKEHIFLFGGIEDVTKEKNDIIVFNKGDMTWKKIQNSTNSAYECSPTLKRDRQKSPNKSPDKITLRRVSPEKGKESDVMKKILNENKQKKFLEKKKELLKQFSEKPNEFNKARSYSPTTESMVKTLQSIGNQENSKNELKQEIIYDETYRFIIGKKPCARDGQTVSLCGERMYIFGGDRHLMAFNDLYSFDLEKGLKSIELYKSS